MLFKNSLKIKDGIFGGILQRKGNNRYSIITFIYNIELSDSNNSLKN